jgi:hypothetical protein
MSTTPGVDALYATHLREALLPVDHYSHKELVFRVAGGGTIEWKRITSFASSSSSNAFPMMVNGTHCYALYVEGRGYTIGPCIGGTDPLDTEIWFDTPEELELWLMACGEHTK